MNDLEARLADLGRSLDLDDTDMVDDVLARLDVDDRTDRPADDRSGGQWRWVRVAAAVVVVVVAAIIAIPDSRRTVAGWLGFDSVSIERRPDLDAPSGPIAAEPLSPGDSRSFEINGRTVVVTAIDGRLSEAYIAKTVGLDTDVEEVEVVGEPGVWISGAPHEVVLYQTPDGAPIVERFAGDTLLWQHGDVLIRIEGLDRLDAALTLAASFDQSQSSGDR